MPATAHAPPVFIPGVINFYIRNHVNTRVVAARRQLNALDRVSAAFRETTPAGITPDSVNGYVRQRTVTDGVAPATVRRELSALRAAINYACRHRLISKADVPHIDLPPHGAPRDFYLSQHDADKLLGFAAGDLGKDGRATRPARFVVLALATGARRRAIEQLRWDQIDLDGGMIRFDVGNHARTKKRRAAVPIVDWLRPYLLLWKDERSGALVLDSASEIDLAPFARRAADATGCPRLAQVYPHALRHTVATLALKAGAPIYEVAKLLGDTVETIERTYAHHMPGVTSAALNWRKLP